MKKYNVSAINLLNDFNLNNTIDNGINIINSHDYHSLLFASAIFPFISKNTPALQMHELKQAQSYTQENRFTKSQLANYIGKPHKNLDHKDIYAILMRESIQNSYNFK